MLHTGFILLKEKKSGPKWVLFIFICLFDLMKDSYMKNMLVSLSPRTVYILGIIEFLEFFSVSGHK